ncbi:MAG: methyltransferase domain-containing protein [Myxococcota bacterium]
MTRAVELHRGGRVGEAVALYAAVLRDRPDDVEALQLCGVAVGRAGRPEEGLRMVERALQLDPAHAPARKNRLRLLGVVAAARLEAGDGAGAETILRAALAEGERAGLYADLGAALVLQDRLTEAAFAWRHALALDPALPLRPRLAAVCATLGARLDPADALSWLAEALRLDPSDAHAAALADAIAQVPDPPDLRDALKVLLARDGIDHQRIEHAVRRVVTGPGDDLFRAWLKRCIVADPAWEARLVKLRREVRDPALMEAIATQAWLTEYVWPEAPGESDGLSGVRAAMYRPVPATPPLKKLMAPVDDAGIETIAMTGDPVSHAVRAQYEENPYPRRIGVHKRPGGSFSAYVRALLPGWEGAAPDRPDVLVAGCGTGQHPLGLAARWPDARVLAVDISRASLARARKTAKEHRIGNVRFAQADVLGLGVLADRFDLVDCVGVLHHLDAPPKGLAVLAGLLKPGGLLRLGVYSERGRAEVVAARAVVAGIADIRAVRAAILALPEDHPARPVVRSVDFYSRSGCRDLVQHVREHRYTPLEVRTLVGSAGLRVVGLQHARPEPARLYRARWPDDVAQADLARWDEIEREHPRIFAGMIQVWLTPLHRV